MIRIASHAGLLLLATLLPLRLLHADVTLDDYGVGQGPVVNTDSTVFDASIVGGARNLFSGSLDVSVIVSTGVLSYSYGGTSGDLMHMTYDGGTGSYPGNPDPNGLGGLDFSGSGADRFVLSLDSSQNIEFDLTVWSSADDSSTALDVAVPDSATSQTLEVSFASFVQTGAVGPADFANVGAMEFQVRPATDSSAATWKVTTFAHNGATAVPVLPPLALGVLSLTLLVSIYFLRFSP